jgi:hypothetical protein
LHDLLNNRLLNNLLNNLLDLLDLLDLDLLDWRMHNFSFHSLVFCSLSDSLLWDIFNGSVLNHLGNVFGLMFNCIVVCYSRFARNDLCSLNGFVFNHGFLIGSIFNAAFGLRLRGLHVGNLGGLDIGNGRLNGHCGLNRLNIRNLLRSLNIRNLLRSLNILNCWLGGLYIGNLGLNVGNGCLVNIGNRSTLSITSSWDIRGRGQGCLNVGSAVRILHFKDLGG